MSNYELYKASNIKSTFDIIMKAYNALSLVVRNLPGWVYWKDLNSVYLGCNREVALQAGFKDPDDIIGKTDFDLPWHEDAERIQRIDQEVIVTGRCIEIEEPIHGPSGKVYTLLTRKSQLIDEQDQLIGMIGVSVDITHKKTMETEISSISKEISDILHKTTW